MSPDVEEYLVHLVMATRDPSPYGAGLTGWLRFGASPRATLALDRCARARAWLRASLGAASDSHLVAVSAAPDKAQAFGVPAFPVDTHIHRLAKRWKLSPGKSVEQVDAFHAAGVANGGTTCEDPPGWRDGPTGRIYLAYLRDPIGNKLCSIYREPK